VGKAATQQPGLLGAKERISSTTIIKRPRAAKALGFG